MSSAAVAHAPQRARCRQIAEADLLQIAPLLTRGFPRSRLAYWQNGLDRLKSLPSIEGLPRFGYVLECLDTIVGVLLLIPSRRGDRLFCNLSSWYVEPEWRAHSSMLVSVATRLKHVTYVNISPAPHTWSTLKAQGFTQYNFGRSGSFPVLGLGRGHVSEHIPEDLPERDLLEAHARMGCYSVVCESGGTLTPFVLKPRRLDKPPLRAAELIYSRTIQDFERCAAPLGRWLLARGRFAVICDGTVDDVVATFVNGKEPRYCKGPHTPSDLAYTERVVFG